jgi:hypothetical protein
MIRLDRERARAGELAHSGRVDAAKVEAHELALTSRASVVTVLFEKWGGPFSGRPGGLAGALFHFGKNRIA